MGVEERHRIKTRIRIKKKSDSVSRAAKYRSLIIGGFLILVGAVSLISMLDYKPDFNSFTDVSKLKDLLSLWPLWITLLGFIFILYDYFKNSSKEKYK